MESRFLTFRRTVMSHYRRHGRHDLPWRKTTDPYAILVSEIMLQQTQVDRVIPKFNAFLKRFPTAEKLARARPSSVLRFWQGLGYNRRALMLQRCARTVVEQYRGVMPDDIERLKKLPGVGPYTAGAILAFAFNKAHPMIETNIRRVYIHHFFQKKKVVDDTDILPLVEATISERDSRAWFSALMDYGTWLSSQTKNPNRKSRGYTTQSRFKGSARQVRGRVIREVLKAKKISISALKKLMNDERLSSVLAGLEREGFLKISRGHVSCA